MDSEGAPHMVAWRKDSFTDTELEIVYWTKSGGEWVEKVIAIGPVWGTAIALLNNQPVVMFDPSGAFEVPVTPILEPATWLLEQFTFS